MIRRAEGLRDGAETCVGDSFAGAVRFGALSHAIVAAFTPDGTSLLSGSSDGFVEVWDVATCRLRRDLSYQAAPDDERFMMHNEAIHALALSRDGDLVVSGCLGGKIKVG